MHEDEHRAIERRVRARILDFVLEQHRDLRHRREGRRTSPRAAIGDSDRRSALSRTSNGHAVDAQPDLRAGVAQPILARRSSRRSGCVNMSPLSGALRSHHGSDSRHWRVIRERAASRCCPARSRAAAATPCRAASISDTRSSVIVVLPWLYTRTVTGTVSRCAMSSRGAVASIDTPAASSSAAVARSFVDRQREREIAASAASHCGRLRLRAPSSVAHVMPLRGARRETLVRRERRDHRSTGRRDSSDATTAASRGRQRIERAARRIGERQRLEARPRRVDAVEQRPSRARWRRTRATPRASRRCTAARAAAARPVPATDAASGSPSRSPSTISPSSGSNSPTLNVSDAPDPSRRSR